MEDKFKVDGETHNVSGQEPIARLYSCTWTFRTKIQIMYKEETCPPQGLHYSVP